MKQEKPVPLYDSAPSGKSLWQRYRVFPDRLELEFFLAGTVRVPFEDVEGVSKRPAGVVFDLFRNRYGLGDLLRAVKLDLADLNEHVVVEKDGFWRQLRLTPDDPDAFVAAFERAYAAWRASAERAQRR